MIVDASVLVAAVSDNGPVGRWAEELFAANELVAPELALLEATNVLRRLELAGSLPRLEAGAALQDLLSLNLALFPFAPVADRIWQLRKTLTSYDACYVAIAEVLEQPLATLDRRLSRAQGPQCQFVLPPGRM